MIRMARKRGFLKGKTFGGIPIMKIVTYGIGAGVSGLVGSQVRKFIPQISNFAEIGGGLAMIILGKKIHPIVKDIGIGILIKEVGDLVEKQVGGFGATTTNSGAWTW